MTLLDISHAHFLIDDNAQCTSEDRLPCDPKTDVQFCGGNNIEQSYVISGIYSSSSGDRQSGAPLYKKPYKFRDYKMKLGYANGRWQMAIVFSRVSSESHSYFFDKYWRARKPSAEENHPWKKTNRQIAHAEYRTFAYTETSKTNLLDPNNVWKMSGFSLI